MKPKSYLFSMALIALIMAMAAFPVVAGTAPVLQSHNYTAAYVNSHTVAHSGGDIALVKAGIPAEGTDIKAGLELTPYAGTTKTGTVDLIGCSTTGRNHRLSLFEVGWRIVLRSA